MRGNIIRYVILIFLFFLIMFLATFIASQQKKPIKNVKEYKLFLPKYYGYPSLPTENYLYSFYYILKNNDISVSFFENENDVDYKEKDICVVTFLTIVTSKLRDHLVINKTKTILINTEKYDKIHSDEFHFIEYFEKIMNKNRENTTVFDFCHYNMIGLRNKYKNIKIEYIPQLYHEYLEFSYTPAIERKNKDIDILITGPLYERREIIFNKLKDKYTIKNIIGVNTEELLHYIERCKILLNISQNIETSIYYDYFRNTHLYANHILVVNETRDFDPNKEKYLTNLEDSTIIVDYDDIPDAVAQILDEKNEKDIDELLQKQYSFIKQYPMEKPVMDFILRH